MPKLFLVFMFVAAQAFANPSTDTVITYECKHIAAKETGFSCSIDKNGRIVLRLHEKTEDQSSDRVERTNYEFHRFALRILELGYSGFYVDADWWTDGHRRTCSHKEGRPYHSYTCADFKQR